MYRLLSLPDFDRWLDGLRDRTAQARIAMRLARMQSGLLGDCKPVGGGVSEARIDYGPGYRVYFVMRDREIIVLLCGSDKRDQDRAIRLARTLARTSP